MKYSIATFGCKMNEHDSENLSGMLEQIGYTQSEMRNEADVIIINTCSIRDNADKRFFGTLGQLKRVKNENPMVTIAICGCMMQQQHIVNTIKAKYHWVDIVFGTHNIHEFPKLLQESLEKKRKTFSIWEENEEIIEGLPAKRKFDFKALVNITFGCNNFCTYCIVPYTRGREKSRNPQDIIKEITNLVKEGVKEVTLLGQNVNSYGNGCEFDLDFAGLIYKINEIEGLERIHFMTSHPKDLSDRLIQAFVDCEKLCNYIHLPVQAGSSKTLERMNRKYTKEAYLALIEKIRKAVPNIGITTDIIVGFPGETDEDFEETLDLMQKARFDFAFTFLYSIRKGTPAEKFEDQVPLAIKQKRFQALSDVMNQITYEKNLECIDNTYSILVEGPSKTNSKMMTGRTMSGKLVNFAAPKETIGKTIDVKIISAKTFSILGEIANKENLC